MSPSDRAGVLLFALAVVAGLALLVSFPGRTHADGGPLCADLNGDEQVTGADLNMVAQAVGSLVPPADQWLDLVPDNQITGNDLNTVAQVIGENCWLHGGPDDAGGESALMMSGCRFLTYGFYGGQPANGTILISDWGGRSYCFSTAGLYVSNCVFGFDALYPERDPQWQLVAVSASVEIGGTYCAAVGYPAYLPCGRQILGKLQHLIRNDSGAYVHGPHVHSEADFGSFGFSVC